MNKDVPPNSPDVVANWPERERYWRRRLGRIRLGVEPIADQLERYRLVACVLTAVCVGIQIMFVALFAAFAHPWIGLAVAGVILGPVIVSSWLGFWRMKSRAARYLREKEEVERLRASKVSAG